MKFYHINKNFFPIRVGNKHILIGPGQSFEIDDMVADVVRLCNGIRRQSLIRLLSSAYKEKELVEALDELIQCEVVLRLSLLSKLKREVLLKAYKFRKRWHDISFKAFDVNPLLWRCKVFSITNFLLKNRANHSKRNFHKMLLVCVGGIGDMVLTTPAIRALKQRFPDSEISILVRSYLQDFYKYCPYIEHIISYPGRQIFRFSWKSMSFFSRLYNEKYHTVLLLQESFGGKYRWLHAKALAYLTGAPRRVGVACQMMRRYFSQTKHLLTDIVQVSRRQHTILTCLEVLRPLEVANRNLKTQVWFTKEDKMYIEQLLDQKKINGEDILVGVNPGASASFKKWPTEKFAQIADWLIRKYQVKIIITGNDSDFRDAFLMEYLMEQEVINLCGRTTLNQLSALIDKCALFISGDTGPAHIAGATGTPLIVLFGPTDPAVFGPLNCDNAVVIRSKNINEISMKQVARAAEKLLLERGLTENSGFDQV